MRINSLHHLPTAAAMPKRPGISMRTSSAFRSNCDPADHVPSTGEYCPYVHVFFQMQDGSYIAFSISAMTSAPCLPQHALVGESPGAGAFQQG
jgi:hypothetical protein